MEEIDFSGSLEIIVKPNSPKNKVLGYDELRKAWRVEIKAPPEDNKANIEVIKLFSKLSKKKVRIISGNTRKHKVLKFE
jgi:uncharacterized protein (TIGR00251 family)